MTGPSVQLSIGGFRITPLCDAFFRLDGGAMHGVVPRVLWERRHPPDEHNRIRLAIRGLLVQADDATIVVEPGLGSRYDAMFRDRFSVDRERTLLDDLRDAGVGADDVDLVICSHLHWDHVGGAVSATADGTLEPTFPRATYVAQQRDWEEANNPHERNRASYRSHDFLPLAERGRLRLVDGAVTIRPGIRVERVGGHSAGMQVVHIGEGADRVVFLADLAPTAYHLDLPVIMAYDLYPMETLESKRQVLDDVIATGARVAFVHDPEISIARVVRDARGRPTLAPSSES